MWVIGLKMAKLSEEYFHSRVHNAIVYEGITEELLSRVIGLFSHEGNGVINLLGTAGEALKEVLHYQMLVSDSY